MMDSRTGRSRGFGYIKFKDNDAVESVLSKRLHIIDDKTVEAKKCNVNMKGKVTDVTLLSGQSKQRHRGFAFVGFDNEDVVKKLIEVRYFVLDGKQVGILFLNTTLSKVEVKAMEPPTTQRSVFSTGHSGISPMHLNGRPAHVAFRGNQFTQLHAGDHVAANAAWPPWAPTPSGNWDGGGASSLGIGNPSHPSGVPTWPPPAWPGAPAGGSGGLVRPSHPGAAYPQPPQVAGQPPSAAPPGGGPLHWPQPSDQRQHQQHAFSPSVNGGWLPSSWSSTINHSGMPTPLANSDMSLRTVQQPTAAVAQPRNKPPASWDSFLYAPMPAGGNGAGNGPGGPALPGGVGAGGVMHQLLENHWPHAQAQQQQQSAQPQQQPAQQRISVAAGNAIYPVSMPGSNGASNGAAQGPGADWTASQWSCRDHRTMANGFSGIDAASEQLINSGSATMGANGALSLANVGSGGSAAPAAPQSSWAPAPPPSGSVDPNSISLDELLYRPPGYGLSTAAVNNVLATGSTDWRSTSAAGLLAQTAGYHSASLQQQQHHQQQQQQHAYRC